MGGSCRCLNLATFRSFSRQPAFKPLVSMPSQLSGMSSGSTKPEKSCAHISSMNWSVTAGWEKVGRIFWRGRFKDPWALDLTIKTIISKI